MATVVAVITDSTACLSAELAAAGGIRVVPLRVVLAGRAVEEGGTAAEWAGAEPAVTIADVERALRAGQRVGTASPAPERFAAAYAAAAAAGADAIVSVHLSARLSGTVNSANLAAGSAPVPVRVVDSQSIGMGLGIAVLTAASAANAGQDAAAVAAAASGRAAGLRSFFALDTPGYLRAGGRLASSPALPGGALTARPLLHIRDGRIAALEKARTGSAAVSRLEQLAVEVAAGKPVDLAVQYLTEPERASALAGRLARIIPTARQVYLAAAGPVICAHTGPGMIGVVVAPC
jgi:DegV family protein with EDD domain